MEYLGAAIGIIVAIVLIVLIIKFIMFLFLNYIISRILSLGTGIASLIVAFSISSAYESGADASGSVIAAIILTALSWLFFIGPVVFDVEWDGTFSVTETYSGYEVSPNMRGGFIGNALGALLVSGAVYLIFGSESPIVFFLLPLLIILITVINFVRAYFF